jgi:predicted ATPase/class 3 adenylate cyclase
MEGETATVLPTGLVTFLITDIEGSTELLQEVGDDSFAPIIERHNTILNDAIRDGDGQVVHVTGDSFFAVFREPNHAIAAAVDAQRALAEENWGTGQGVRVRMGMHCGAARLGGGDYVGLDVHRTARISAVAHGGQILVSAEAAHSIEPLLPADVRLRDLGSHKLKDLSKPEGLFQVVVPDLQSEFSPLRSMTAVLGGQPPATTSFVGRSTQVGEISDLLGESRVVTLTGPGGTGKTRLAIRAAEESAARFSDGAYFVDLAALVDESLIPGAILNVLERPPNPGLALRDQLRTFLVGKEVLLVLDNYEQLLPHVSAVREILDTGGGVRLLVTSRAPLHLSAEQEYPVPPLANPDRTHRDDLEELLHFESVELFVNRARTVRPDFTLTAQNSRAVVDLTRRLDGLPLAIELAASRVRVLSPSEILDRLSNRLLANTSADLPQRQQTIANAVEWSYDLLDERMRRFFDRLSVFSGGAMLAEIEAVCAPEGESGADPLEAIATLVEHSLLEATGGFSGTRYQMLVVVREFAAEKLLERGEGDEIRDRHLQVFAELAKRAGPLLLSSHQGKWLDRLAWEQDNLRAALDRAVAIESTDVAHGMVVDLWRFWQRRGHLQEGIATTRAVLQLPNASPLGRAKALEALGGLLYWKGDWAEAIEPYRESLELARRYGAPGDVANALFNSSFPLNASGDPISAERNLRESLAISEREGNSLGRGRALWGLCDLNFMSRNLEQALEYGKRAEGEFEQLDAPFDLGWARFMIAYASFGVGDYETCRRYVDAALTLFLDAGDLSALVLIMYVKAGVLTVDGDVLTAARILGALDGVISQTGVGLGELGPNQLDEVWDVRRLDDPEVREAMAAGRSLTIDESIELVLTA